ncbi:MAG: DUF58 domain-containing protein [Pseudomonadota bacterium]
MTALDSAAALAQARDLEWLARRALRGDPFGRQTGHDVAPGSEFSQYRAYESGDDARWLDWRRMARNDDTLLRLAPREARTNVSVLIDTSASMAEPDGRRDWTRVDAAKAIAAVALAVARRQGDSFAYRTLNMAAGASITHSHGDAHLARCLQTLGNENCRGGWPDRAQTDALTRTLPRSGLVLVLSDFFAESDALGHLADALRAPAREVIAIQLLTQREVEFDYSGQIEMVDRETGRRVAIDAARHRATFLARFEAARRALRRQFQRRGIAFESAFIHDAPDHILRRALARPHRARPRE